MRKKKTPTPSGSGSNRPKPANDEIYHIYNRGVDKRDVFLDDQDRFRFVHDLFEFNDTVPAGKWHESEIGSPNMRPKRDTVVDVLAFCLMPNHFHLMLRQKQEHGVSEFMKKLGIGYTYYFNKRYNRDGSLFQGKYKLVHIAEQNHFQHLPYYIHLNPLDLIYPDWRDGTITDTEKALRFLEQYRWSSYLDYAGKKNFPSVTQREFLAYTLESPDKQRQNMMEWVQREEFENIEHLSLE